mmetsp:Transcript_75708/g.239379  ORF Transcript_75708/g.239379 Transcript_75708/m.239379 type:complete len:253 (+) Transcript_75708:150-908(+)
MRGAVVRKVAKGRRSAGATMAGRGPEEADEARSARQVFVGVQARAEGERPAPASPGPAAEALCRAAWGCARHRGGGAAEGAGAGEEQQAAGKGQAAQAQGTEPFAGPRREAPERGGPPGDAQDRSGGDECGPEEQQAPAPGCEPPARPQAQRCPGPAGVLAAAPQGPARTLGQHVSAKDPRTARHRRAALRERPKQVATGPELQPPRPAGCGSGSRSHRSAHQPALLLGLSELRSLYARAATRRCSVHEGFA